MTKKMMPETNSGRLLGSLNYFEKCLGLTGAYRVYRKSLTQGETGVETQKIYSIICKAANKRLMKKIIEEATEFVMPFGLGRLRVKKKLITHPRTNLINWKESNKLGRHVYFINEHSNGFLMKFFWDKAFVHTNNITKYQFRASKANKLYLHDVIMNSPSVDYYE